MKYEIQIWDSCTGGKTETYYIKEEAIKRYNELKIGEIAPTGTEKTRLITHVIFKEIVREKDKDSVNQNFY